MSNKWTTSEETPTRRVSIDKNGIKRVEIKRVDSKTMHGESYISTNWKVRSYSKDGQYSSTLRGLKEKLNP